MSDILGSRYRIGLRYCRDDADSQARRAAASRSRAACAGCMKARAPLIILALSTSIAPRFRLHYFLASAGAAPRIAAAGRQRLPRFERADGRLLFTLPRACSPPGANAAFIASGCRQPGAAGTPPQTPQRWRWRAAESRRWRRVSFDADLHRRCLFCQAGQGLPPYFSAAQDISLAQ